MGKMMKLQVPTLTIVLLLLAVCWQSQSLPQHHHNKRENDGCSAGYRMVPTKNRDFPSGKDQCCEIKRPFCCVDIPDRYVRCNNGTHGWGGKSQNWRDISLYFLHSGLKNGS